MIEYKRRGKLYQIKLGNVELRSGSDRTIFAYIVSCPADGSSFIMFIHFPNSLILQRRLPSHVLYELSEKKVMEWLDRNVENEANIYIVPEDVPYLSGADS